MPSMPPKLDSLVQNGFYLSDHNSRYRDFAFLSLELGLRAFCGTYEPIKTKFSNIIDASSSNFNETQYGLTYIERATETILHFQHFAELVCKELLRGIHPLLAHESSATAIVKAVRGQLTDSDIPTLNLKTHQFSTNLQYIAELKKANLLSSDMVRTVDSHLQSLIKLNELRNRLWHRGTFALHYTALDQFVGFYLLPFVRAVMRSKSLRKPDWLLELDTASRIKPLRAIAYSFAKNNYEPKRIAILKELARAAYDNPIRGGTWSGIDDDRIKRAAVEAAAARQVNVESIVNCPVCGVESLVLTEDTLDCDDPEDGSAGTYVFEVECDCCGFCLWSDVGAPSDVGLNLPNYWKHHKRG